MRLVEESRDTNNIGRGGDRLTIAEAAALLGVHKNTVRNRIKSGSYRAEIVHTERGPTYLIERTSLLTNLNTNTLSSASQEVVSPQAMEFVQELLRPFVSELGEVREQLGAERARREKRLRRSRGSRRGQRTGRPPRRLRRSYRGLGGVGYWGGRAKGAAIQQLNDFQR